nr:hypothetical protein [candidate division Zixibacteria bacterium]
MSLKFTCPSCGAEILLKYLKPGDTARCRNCGHDVIVPDTAEISDRIPEYTNFLPIQPPPLSPPVEKNILGPRDISEIFGESFRIYVKHFLNLMIMTALIYLPLYILSHINIWNNLDITSFHNGDIIISFPEAILFMIETIVVAPLYNAAIVCLIGDQYLNRKIKIGHSYKRAFKRYGTMVFAGILYSLAVTALLITIVGIPFAIYLSVAWYVFIPAILFEKCGVLDSLARSRNLVKGSWWKIFWIGLILNIVMFVLMIIFELVPDYIKHLGWMIASPLIPIVGVIIYFDLRVRKDGYNPDALEKEMDTLESQVSRPVVLGQAE